LPYTGPNSPRSSAHSSQIDTPFFESPGIVNDLKARGHWFKLVKPYGNAQAIFYDSSADVYVGVSDPRGVGEAKGY